MVVLVIRHHRKRVISMGSEGKVCTVTGFHPNNYFLARRKKISWPPGSFPPNGIISKPQLSQQTRDDRK